MFILWTCLDSALYSLKFSLDWTWAQTLIKVLPPELGLSPAEMIWSAWTDLVILKSTKYLQTLQTFNIALTCEVHLLSPPGNQMYSICLKLHSDWLVSKWHYWLNCLCSIWETKLGSTSLRHVLFIKLPAVDALWWCMKLLYTSRVSGSSDVSCLVWISSNISILRTS